MAFVKGERYILEYWPRYFDGFGKPTKRASATVIQEFIYTEDSRIMEWTGNYTMLSTHTINPKDIVRVINLKEKS